tara:strand:+ start:275 stop:631 length:357 start_codon:yes stop_codon:yes gene_type:complete
MRILSAKAGNLLLTGTTSRYKQELWQLFPTTRARAQILLLGGLAASKIMGAVQDDDIDYDVLMHLLTCHPYITSMAAVFMQDEVHPQKTDRPHRLDLVATMFSDEERRAATSNYSGPI